MRFTRKLKGKNYPLILYHYKTAIVNKQAIFLIFNM